MSSNESSASLSILLKKVKIGIPRLATTLKSFLVCASTPLLGRTADGASAAALRYDGAGAHRGDPAIALKLRPGAVSVLVCGCDDAEKLLALTDVQNALHALERTRRFWRDRTDVLALRSPERALDRLMNGWALYQTLACRLLGRCSVYQNGGAFGFRDQLQDAVNLLLTAPKLCREQLLRCAARQYPEGDVQHWWHETGGAAKGIRTRCSDDLLWLPWAAAEYAEQSGDRDTLLTSVPYLESPPLRPEERDRYEAPAATAENEPLWAHGLRALRRVMERGVGPHGLLLIGSGDWNDGFDRVGGESEWLSWFFLDAADRFLAACPVPEPARAELEAFCTRLCAAAEEAWDGEWYRRGYYADGAPLGSRESAECRIDSLAQSWAVLSGRARPERAKQALKNAVEQLYDRKHGLVRLFTPPFAGAEDPGYLRSYGPGLRENGGQYTHGALWLVRALLRAGRTDEGWALLRDMLPAGKDPARYQGEPYVLAADVCAAPGHEGEAGWTWYTGSSGWLFRIVTEDLLGLKMRGGRLYIEPRLPSPWSGYAATLRTRRIEVQDGRITVDGREYRGQGLAL